MLNGFSLLPFLPLLLLSGISFAVLLLIDKAWSRRFARRREARKTQVDASSDKPLPIAA